MTGKIVSLADVVHQNLIKHSTKCVATPISNTIIWILHLCCKHIVLTQTYFQNKHVSQPKLQYLPSLTSETNMYLHVAVVRICEIITIVNGTKK